MNTNKDCFKVETLWLDTHKKLSKKNISLKDYMEEINKATVNDIFTHHRSSTVFQMINDVISRENIRYSNLLFNLSPVTNGKLNKHHERRKK